MSQFIEQIVLSPSLLLQGHLGGAISGLIMRKRTSDIVVLSFSSSIVSCAEKLRFCPFWFVLVSPLIQTDSNEPRSILPWILQLEWWKKVYSLCRSVLAAENWHLWFQLSYWNNYGNIASTTKHWTSRDCRYYATIIFRFTVTTIYHVVT